MHAEGWYVDPFARHEARWISDGSPTALVRDGHVESQDPPPDGGYTGEFVPLPEEDRPDGADLRRADEVEAVDPRTGPELRDVLDSANQTGYPLTD